ncbi:beta-ketoacyl synthase chain length factor [Mucilaginibacter sp. X5P1]|uniref:beta-ketoacyl synthase chain length factor n=1 Tax=Mucilaginibacter sp. X5P1 TaxID=2723088 RepID=UPI0016153D21|nr:beta-ketoacyl synthase chain length factor [Mucilaginibacter sp. X5P1]MBB6137840.1 3-oxoacyl-(acyl-carrier-protein) synthase [Mucilaginibacter sp. X5P1]
MKLYIRSSACVSPQNTFNHEGFLNDIVEYTGTRLKAIEPDYKQFIDPKQIRRMSHVIKMGVAAAKQCLIDADVDMPGAIITGTALGCIEDTVTFLTRIIEQQEELLPPTAFIQSTHNTVAAQIALMLKCHSYNSTFVHKGISFESALFDAIMMLKEQDAENVLVGGTEEMVDTSFKILTRLGLYKRQPVSNLSLFVPSSKGTIGGEGAVFFLLTSEDSSANLAELTGLKILYKPKSIEESITVFLKSHSLTIDDIDMMITGRNGDIKNDAVYEQLNGSLFKNTSLANYKHLCGEYPVSSSFALWMAANILKSGVVPEIIRERIVGEDTNNGEADNASPKTILIYNHYQNKYHSLMLVSAI